MCVCLFVILEKMPSNKELPADLKTSMYVCPECDFYCANEDRMKLHYRFCKGGVYNLDFYIKLKKKKKTFYKVV